MKNNKKAMSLILAMWLVLIMTLLVLYILEYIIPYSKNVKGIENSTNAFYQADGSIEVGLKYIKDRNIDVNKWNWDLRTETGSSFLSNKVAFSLSTTSSWKVIPPDKLWNSPYDNHFNTISAWEPIQLSVWNGMVTNWFNVKFTFKIPEKLNNNWFWLSWWTWAIINWQLAWLWNTLNATGSWILSDDIWNNWLNSKIFWWWVSNSLWVDYIKWLDLNSNSVDYSAFYSQNCNNTWSWCILKMFLVWDLIWNDPNKTRLPFLEYKIDFGNSKVPLRYSTIKSVWKSYWFQKELETKVAQDTVNEAFGFTILQ